MLLLLALMLIASHVAMAAHEIGHASGPDSTQQCPLCVSGVQPFGKPAQEAVPELTDLEHFHPSPAATNNLRSNAAYHDQNPRAPPVIT